MSKYSEMILSLMKERQLSYGELSRLTNIPKSALQRYGIGETEKIPLDRLEAIAKALGVSPAYLLGWENEDGELVEKELLTKFSEEELRLARMFKNLSEQSRELILEQTSHLLSLESKDPQSNE